MSNPIWAMLIGVGVGLAYTVYMYYQEQTNRQSYENRPPNQSGTSNDWDRPVPPTNGSRRSRNPRRNEPCVICMDEKSQDSWRTLDCSHRFHEKCVSKWFNEKQNCPSCRTRVGSSFWA